MRNLLLGLSLSLAFIIGCVASQFIVPPVRAGVDPVRWEYVCPDSGGFLVDQFNELGAKGWEMVTTWQSNCFKRRLP